MQEKMLEWHVKHEIDYSPNGDDVDKFSQKVKAEVKIIYHLLNRLRKLDAQAGTTGDAVPYQLRVDTAGKNLLMRNSTNDGWNLLGRIDKDFLGITAEDISAVRNTGDISAIYGGSISSRPKSANIHDLFYDFDNKKLYFWSGTAWETFLSLNFADLCDYEKYCILREEVDYSGKDKVLRLDKSTGKANVDITGSPDKLLGYAIEVSNLKDDEVFTFDAQKKKIVNKARNEIVKSDVSANGEANKIVQTDNAGVANVSISGSAAYIDGLKVKAAGVKDGQVLAFESSTKSLKPVNKDYFTNENVSTSGEIGKLIKLGSDKTIHANLDGSASKIDNITVDTAGISHNQILAFDAKQKKFIAADKDEITSADISTTGQAGKLIKLDNSRTIHADLDGDAKSVNGVSIGTLKNGELISFDAKNKQLTTTANTYLTDEEVSETGEAGKLIKLPKNKTVQMNISGSASQIDGVVVDLSGIKNGKLLQYDAVNNALIPTTNDFLRKSDVGNESENKLVVYDEDGKIDADIKGSAARIDGVRVSTDGMINGQVLIYDSSKNTLIPGDKDYITEENISDTSEIGKLIKMPVNKKLICDISGSANGLDGVNVIAANADDGDVLVYHSSTNSFTPEPKNSSAGGGKYLIIKNDSQILKEYNGAKTIEFDMAPYINNVNTAKKWTNTRKLTLSGWASGEVEFDGSKDVTLRIYDIRAIISDIAHSAEKSEKLTNARRITITGDASGSAYFDGTSDVTIAVSVNNAGSVDFSDYVTNSALNTKLSDYAKKSEIPASADLSNYVQLSTLISLLNDYAKKSELSGDVDLSGYVKTSDLQTLIENYAQSSASSVVTKSEVERDYVKKEDLINALETALGNTTLNISTANAVIAKTAEKLSTPIAIKVNGAMEGETVLDGSSDVTLELATPEASVMSDSDVEELF